MTLPDSQAPGRVLVVEDDKDIRDSVVEVLREEGYRVCGVPNGAEALRDLRHNGAPCVILLDLMMPVMDGFQFRCEQQRDTALSAIPVVVLSADGNAKQRASEMNVSDGLAKPVRLDELLRMVARYCHCA